MNGLIVKTSIFFGVIGAIVTIVNSTVPLTLTLGLTAYTLSITQVSLAVASLAGLAIAKEAVAINEIARTRGKRDVFSAERALSDNNNFLAYFDAVASSDKYDCAKLLTCNSMAKNEEYLTDEERLIKKLFKDVQSEETVQGSSYALFQLAAVAGIRHRSTELCLAEFPQCPISLEELANLVNVKA